MRFLGIFILVVFGAGVNSFEILIADKERSLETFAHLFADTVVANLLPYADLTNYETKEDGSWLIPIIKRGVLPEKIPFANARIPLPDNDLVTGSYRHAGTNFEGLHTFGMDAEITFVVPLRIRINSSAEEFAIRGSEYDMDLNFNMENLIGLLFPDLVAFFPPNLNVSGLGDYELVALKPYFNMVVELIFRGDKPYVRTESVNLGFGGVNIFFRGMQMGGLDFDWGVINFDDVNNLVMALIHAVEPVLPAGFDFVFQFLIANCSPTELISGNLTCIGLGIVPQNHAGQGIASGSYMYTSSTLILISIIFATLMTILPK